MTLRQYTSPHIIVSVQNPTYHDLMLTGKTVIGTVQKVQAVYPAAFLEGPGLTSAGINKVETNISHTSDTTWVPPVDLSQGSSNLILEGRCPAEFSSNLPQHTCMEVSSIASKTLISCFRCV